MFILTVNLIATLFWGFLGKVFLNDFKERNGMNKDSVFDFEKNQNLILIMFWPILPIDETFKFGLLQKFLNLV